MNVFLLITVAVGLVIQNITKKEYSVKLSGGAFSFSTMSVIVAAVCCMVFTGGKFDFNRSVLPYSGLFAFFYSTAILFSTLAIKNGPLSLTSLIISYSLLIPTFYGMLILNEQLKWQKIMGVLLLIVSLFCINFQKKKENQKFNFKWFVYVFLAFLGNGMCSTMQKAQQIKFNGLYKNEFMIIAYIASAVVLFVATIIYEKRALIYSIKKGYKFWGLCGIGNAAVNLLVLILSARMPASVMFPLISAGSILATVIVSITVYREKLSFLQKYGIASGLLAIVLLNL